METDSKVALTLILNEKQLWNWKLINILSRITKIISSMNVKVTHLFREGNSAADWLANDALKRRMSQEIRVENLPIHVRKIAYLDKHGLPYIRNCKA